MKLVFALIDGFWSLMALDPSDLSFYPPDVRFMYSDPYPAEAFTYIEESFRDPRNNVLYTRVLCINNFSSLLVRADGLVSWHELTEVIPYQENIHNVIVIYQVSYNAKDYPWILQNWINHNDAPLIVDVSHANAMQALSQSKQALTKAEAEIFSLRTQLNERKKQVHEPLNDLPAEENHSFTHQESMPKESVSGPSTPPTELNFSIEEANIDKSPQFVINAQEHGPSSNAEDVNDAANVQEAPSGESSLSQTKGIY